MDTPDPSASPAAGATLPVAQHSALFDELGAMVNQAGGVAGLAQQFEQKGLGGVMSGWVGNGANPPINEGQIMQVLGSGPVTALAGKLGLSQAQVTSGISTLLPLLIHELTPQGTVPAHNPDEFGSAFNLIKSRLFGA